MELRVKDQALGPRVLSRQGTHHPLQLRRGWSPLPRHPREERGRLTLKAQPFQLPQTVSASKLLH
ncbi:MAG: hypothetical protein ACTHLH_04490 [Solirubrobacterales bacterium]